MTSSEMLSKLRTLLDEATASYWTDANCYSALTDGQLACANYSLAIYKYKQTIIKDTKLPDALEKLLVLVSSNISSTQYSFALPPDFMYDIALKYAPLGGTMLPCRRREINTEYFFNRDNTYMADNQTSGYYYSITDVNVVFETVATTTAYYQFWYLRYPTDISGAIEPMLPESMHIAIIYYAFALLMQKDHQTEKAGVYFDKFLEEIKGK